MSLWVIHLTKRATVSLESLGRFISTAAEHDRIAVLICGDAELPVHDSGAVAHHANSYLEESPLHKLGQHRQTLLFEQIPGVFKSSLQELFQWSEVTGLRQRALALLFCFIIIIGFLIILLVFLGYCFLRKEQSLRWGFLTLVRRLDAEERLEERVPSAELGESGSCRLLAFLAAEGRRSCMNQGFHQARDGGVSGPVLLANKRLGRADPLRRCLLLPDSGGPTHGRRRAQFGNGGGWGAL